MEFNLLKDVYYKPEYISLYLEPDGELFEFSYKEGNKEFLSRCIKRPIKQLEGFFDLESAYGYGGFYINTNDSSFIKRAFDKYRNYCKEHNIVAQFVRFHPFLNYFDTFQNLKVLDFFQPNKKVVIVNLQEDLKYKKDLKKSLRKISKFGLKFHTVEHINSSLIEKFINLYYKTMLRKNAEKFYFFSKNYFYKLLSFGFSRLFFATLEEKILGMIIVLESSINSIIYSHLGAFDELAYKFRVNDFLKDRIINFYKAKAFNYYILGGGKEDNDSLFKYKSRFSPLWKNYYIGGLVFNREVYQKLYELAKPEKNFYFLFWR